MHIERLGVALFLSFVASACSSGSDFQVASDTGSTDDAATTDSLVTGDADAGVDPCADEPGKAKFCVTVNAEVGPAYTSAATSLGLDGKGLLKVYLYDKDPSTGTKEAPIPPVATLRYGAIGEKLAIDKLPVTLVDSVAKSGTYWVIGSFADAERPETDGANRVGDFVSVPLAYDKKTAKATWAKLDMVVGKTTRQNLKLYPLRRVDLELRVGKEISDMLATGKYLANGDGPLLVMLYDGVLGGAGEAVQFGDVIPCVTTKPKELAPKPVPVSFLTAVTGSHNVLTGLVDFPGDGFPNRGTFLCDYAGTTIPKIDIKGSEWVASATVRLITIYDAYEAADPVIDTLVCK